LNLGKAVIAAVFGTLILLTAALFWSAAAKHRASGREWHLFSDSGKSPFSDGPARLTRDAAEAPPVADQEKAQRSLSQAFPGDAPRVDATRSNSSAPAAPNRAGPEAPR
jgi:hypothetical protein